MDEPLDLLVRGGRVIDPASVLEAIRDVGVRYGRIARSPRICPISWPGAARSTRRRTGTTIVEAAGKIVVPGPRRPPRARLHRRLSATVPADETSAASGVTTIVSAGDAGAHTIEGFRQLIVNQSRTRGPGVRAHLDGRPDRLAGGRGDRSQLPRRRKAVRAIEENRDFVVGIKVREQAPLIVGDNGPEPVRSRSRQASAPAFP